ncbi:hypothetical protein Tco_1411808 [Tanacetum coccineum]
MEPDIKNMTINDYLEYEAEKESVTLDFLHYYKDVLINKYYALPPLLPCFQPSQPYKECGYASPDENEEVDIESMTIAEYNLYVAKQGLKKNPLNDHSYGFTGNAYEVVLGCYSSCKEAFQAGLVGCYIGDDDELLGSWMLLKEADLEHGLEHDVSSSYQANLGEFSILFLTLPILILYAYV